MAHLPDDADRPCRAGHPDGAHHPDWDRRPDEGVPLVSRRAFVAGMVTLAGVAAGLSGCGQGTAGRPAPSPSRWVAVAVDDLATAEARWVEFTVDGSEGSTADPVQVAGPSARPPTGTFPPARSGAWLVRQQDGSVVAFVPRCTHHACAYDWEREQSRFHCRCHEGYFGIDGRVLGGPPPRPLARYQTRPGAGGSIEIGWYPPAQAALARPGSDRG